MRLGWLETAYSRLIMGGQFLSVESVKLA